MNMDISNIISDAVTEVMKAFPVMNLELAKKQHPIINLVGGIVNRESISVTGTMAIDFLSDINIDIAFSSI